jgi:hypothetical protein
MTGGNFIFYIYTQQIFDYLLRRVNINVQKEGQQLWLLLFLKDNKEKKTLVKEDEEIIFKLCQYEINSDIRKGSIRDIVDLSLIVNEYVGGQNKIEINNPENIN